MDDTIFRPDAPDPDSRSVSRRLSETIRCRALELGDEIQRLVESDEAFNADGVHEIRVGTKKLRALWQLVRPVIGPGIAKSAHKRLKATARSLAEARDARVLTETLEDLKGSEESLYHGAFDRAAALLVDDTATDLATDELRTQMLGTLETDRAEWRSLVLPDDRALLETGLHRAYGRGLESLGLAAADPTHDNWHELRRWIKHLRYQLESLAAESPGGLADRIGDLKHLGRLLGRKNDLAVLVERLELRRGGDPFGPVLRAASMRDSALSTQVDDLSARLFADEPQAFVAAVGARLVPPEASVPDDS